MVQCDGTVGSRASQFGGTVDVTGDIDNGRARIHTLGLTAIQHTVHTLNDIHNHFILCIECRRAAPWRFACHGLGQMVGYIGGSFFDTVENATRNGWRPDHFLEGITLNNQSHTAVYKFIKQLNHRGKVVTESRPSVGAILGTKVVHE